MLDLSWAHLLNWDRRGVSHRDATIEAKGVPMSCFALVVCCGTGRTLGRLRAYLMAFNCKLYR